MSLAARLRAWLDAGEAAMAVRVDAVRGSTPREAGALLLVTARETAGTIGGGQLEYLATDRARALLRDGAAGEAMDVSLGAEIGQCCGGRVRLDLRRTDAALLAALADEEAAASAARPSVLVFGAGHVGRALVAALRLLPVRIAWIATRPDAFETDAASDVAQIVAADALEATVAAAPAGSACIVLTHSHALDALITAAALARDDLAYVGLIGSATKRLRFERAFRAEGLSEARIARLVCPIGGALRDKRPAVIAALTAAEVLRALAAHRATLDARHAA